MLFALIYTDKPDSQALRQATREAHLAYLQPHAAKMLQAGPMLDAHGQPCGSLLLVDVADLAEAERFSEADPYNRAGLFADVTIRAYRQVYRDGDLVA